MKKWIILLVAIYLFVFTISLTGFGSSSDKVIIYSNADEEAIDMMEAALDKVGYKDEYIIQPQPTSELGGKILVEGKHIEADVITQASYYIDSAQEKHKMFQNIKSDKEPTQDSSDYTLPLLGNTGSIFINEKALKDKNLPVPKSIKDLTKSKYKNQIAMANMLDSSTGWLVVQSIFDQYGEKEGKEILTKLFQNIGPHLESSGSGPLKKVQSGEVAIGIGLRSQAIEASKKSQYIKNIDPKEGNYSLIESLAVVDKGSKKQKKAADMAKAIQKHARKDLIKQYPKAIYKGEKVEKSQLPKYPKSWDDKLTVQLLDKHQVIYKEAKKNAETKERGK